MHQQTPFLTSTFCDHWSVKFHDDNSVHQIISNFSQLTPLRAVRAGNMMPFYSPITALTLYIIMYTVYLDNEFHHTVCAGHLRG